MLVKGELPYERISCLLHLCVLRDFSCFHQPASSAALYDDNLLTGTFDVQNVEVRLINNEYEIICYFATGSKARGCRIVLTNDQEEEKEECNAQRLEGVGEAVIKATLPAGEYSLLVYDDDDDYMGQENPAYHTYVSSTSPDFHNIGKISC